MTNLRFLIKKIYLSIREFFKQSKKVFINMRLRRKLLISYIAVTIIPMIIIGAISYIKSSDTIIQQTNNYASLVVEKINSDIDSYIDKFARISYTTYSNVEFQKILQFNHEQPFRFRLDNRDKMNQFLLGIINLDANIDGAYIYTKYGELYYKNVRGNIYEGYNFKNEYWYDKIINGDIKSVLVPVHTEKKLTGIVDQRNFSFVIGVIDIYTSKTVGFMVIDINEKALYDVVKIAEKKLDGRILIVDNTENIIYDSKREVFGINFLNFYNELNNDIRNKNILITNNSSTTGWKVIFITPLDKLRENANEVRNFTVVVGLICIIAFILLSTIISEGISRPINRLKDTIKLVENGDLEAGVKIESEDEFGQLGRSFNKMVVNINNLIREVYETQLKKKEAELNALQSQINPHFMYNTLESINMMAILAGNLEISDVLSAFASILRFNLDNKKNIIPIEKELKYVYDYLSIQKLRFKDKFDVEFDIGPNIEKYEILKLAIQPLVENSILHGFSELKGKGRMVISAKNEEDLIRVIVNDNGIGMSEQRLEEVNKSLQFEEALSKPGSIGLNNINERIKLFYGSNYGINISSALGKGTCVELIIPAREKGT